LCLRYNDQESTKNNQEKFQMPIIKSAKKRVRVTASKSTRNAKTKKGLRGAIKAFHSAIKGGSKMSESRNAAQSAIDKAVKKGVISKNKAARKKRQLSASAKKAGAKPTASAKKAAKPAAKKTAAKKPSAKKAAPKKK
jgi:small subunit ribosomal protein S20